jgi:hypothetical protein
MGCNFKLVVTKGISAAAQIEATTVVGLSCGRYWWHALDIFSF